MSFRCVILLKQDARWQGQPPTQTSSLRFPAIEEARAFGQVMFEPLQSIESWDIESVDEPPNYTYRKGQLKRAIAKEPTSIRPLVSGRDIV